ncbi:hypothetical protein ACJA28_00545 [Mesomycoplasma moatsii]|uniref:tRNA-binding protein n=1 Tax=Mesomycoplasma moatsii TaxID=171287 RepID=UPI0003B6AA02
MSISLVNNHKFFNNKKNVSFLFRDVSNDYDFETKKEGDFIFIFVNNKVVGLNVLNYQQYFQVEEGFHRIKEKVQKYLIDKFPNYLKEENFVSFYKIGKVNQIKNHPSSEKLKVLNVIFNDKERQIITNFQNIELNKNYLFAINGAIIYSGLKILNSKIINVSSEGMIMSYQSLGINQEGLVNCDDLTIDDEYNF